MAPCQCNLLALTSSKSPIHKRVCPRPARRPTPPAAAGAEHHLTLPGASLACGWEPALPCAGHTAHAGLHSSGRGRRLPPPAPPRCAGRLHSAAQTDAELMGDASTSRQGIEGGGTAQHSTAQHSTAQHHVGTAATAPETQPRRQAPRPLTAEGGQAQRLPHHNNQWDALRQWATL